LADTGSLATLPPREFRAGYAEMAKYGLIDDPAFLSWLERHWGAGFARGPALTKAIATSCASKAAIVARDETEQGDRALLNLGHTFGHAVESATHYTQWLHGEAIGAGLLMAAGMSRECGLMSAEEVLRVQKLIARTGLPTYIEGVSPETAF